MERHDLEDWFAHHPDSIHSQPGPLLDHCEAEIRDHAKQDAWIHAREIAQESLQRFEGLFGLPASDDFVTKEVCHLVARELKRHEPHPDDRQAAEWVGQSILGALDGDARERLRIWLLELAEKEEHTAWRSIVHFTDHLARTLIRERHLTRDLDWDFDRSYPRVAARVARMMISEFDARASASGTRLD